MSSTYYLSLSIIALSLTIYNFSISNRGNPLQCYNVKYWNYQEYVQYNKTLNLPTYPNSELTKETYTIEEETSDTFEPLTAWIGVTFIIFFLLSIYWSIAIHSLSDQIPSDFIQMGIFKKINAMLCKWLPKLLIILSYLLFLLIIILWGFIWRKKCVHSLAKSSSGEIVRDKRKYYDEVNTLNIVNLVVWIVFHYVFACIRQAVYIEPFMYDPVIGDNWKVIKWIVLKNLGP